MTDASSLPVRHNVVLVGFMGSGKSSIGRLLATRLRFQFVDTDQIVVQRSGIEIPAIFAQHGETHFRDLESSVLASLAHLERCVIATGGGIVIRERNRELLRGLGFVVALSAREEVILERVSRNARRPLLQTADPSATVREMLAARQPWYDAAATLTVDTSNLGHAEVADVIVAEARRVFGWSVSGTNERNAAD